jgi:hypothetical protein
MEDSKTAKNQKQKQSLVEGWVPGFVLERIWLRV